VADLQYYGTGRRKSATARVYLRAGTGEFKVNRTSIENYFKNETLRMIIRQPSSLTDTLAKFDILINVAGGGSRGSGRSCQARYRSCPLRNSTPSCARSSRRPAS
jgi:small subunit ribosomal protein S9